MFAANEVGQVNHAFRVGRAHGTHHILELRNVSADRGDDFRTKITEGVRVGV